MKSQYQFSFGCILVLQYYSLITSANLIVIKPPGDVYSLVKSSLQINCSYSTNEEVPIGKIDLQYCSPREGCTALQTIPIDNATITYYLINITRADTGVYVCKADKDEDYMHLYVDDFPQVPTTINCYSLNRVEMVCTWDITEANQGKLKINWTASTIVYGQCPRWNVNETTLSCEWPSSRNEKKLTKIFHYIPDVYTIVLKGRNILGERTKVFSVNISQIVKISQFQLEVVSTGSRAITLRWSIPDEFYDSSYNLTTVYKISYTSRWNTVPEQAVFVSSNRSLVYTVKDISAYTQYHISLTGKPIESRYWSDKTAIKSTTKAEVPGRAPQLLNGMYYVDTSNIQLKLPKRKLTVFLKSINETHIHSYFANYSIILSEITQPNEMEVCSYNITYTTVTVKFELETDKLYRVSGNSYNDVGYSIESSEITIPAPYSNAPAVKHVFVEKIGDSREYLFSWEDNEDNAAKQVASHRFVVFWCKGGTKKNFCESNVEWSIVPSNSSTTRIFIDNYDQYQLLFGVSIYDQYKNISGGLHFADCIFPSKNAIERPEIELIPNTANSMRLDALLISDFCEYESRPMEYILYYGENKWADDMECRDIIDKMSVLNYSATPEVKTKAIDNLKPDTDYSVCFKVLLRGGKIRISDRKTKRTLSTSQTNMAVIILSTAGGTVLLVTLICAICYGKRRYENEEMKIEIPEINKYEKKPGYEIISNGGFSLENMEKNYCDLTNSNQLYKKVDDSGHYSNGDAENQTPECSPNVDETELVIMEISTDVEKSYISVEFEGGVNSNYHPYPYEPKESSEETELEYKMQSTSNTLNAKTLRACSHGELSTNQNKSTPNISTFSSKSCRESSVYIEGTSSGSNSILYTNKSDTSDYRQVYSKHNIRNEICSHDTNIANNSEESQTQKEMPSLENMFEFEDSVSDPGSEINEYSNKEEMACENGYSKFEILESDFCESDSDNASDFVEYCKVTKSSNSMVEYKEFLTSV